MTQQASGAATTEAKPAVQPAATPVALTREDVQTMIKEGFAEFAKTLQPATPGAATEAVRSEATPPAEGTKVVETLTRADLVAAMGEALKPLDERMKKVEGLTVVRSEQEQVPAEKKEESKDVFRGALPGLRKPAAKT